MNTDNKLKIAIIGARGIGNYGGFESVISELGPSLVERGYIVYCSCEKSNLREESSEYNGVKKIYFPFKPPSTYTTRKIFEILYDFYFTIKCSLSCDIIYALGIGTSFSLIFPRIFKKISVVNVDGLEWRRSKFSSIEKIFLKMMFLTCVILSNIIIVDNNNLINYVDIKYNKKIVFIPYGVSSTKYIPWDINKLTNIAVKEDLNIFPNNFWLVVARLEPENNIHVIVESFIKSKSKMPLVIIGDFTSESYENNVYNMVFKDSNKIFFLGSIYDIDLLNMFRQNCFGYIHGHSVGGTNPSLLEAMVMGNIIIAHHNEFNKEVGDNSITYFDDINDLKCKIEDIERNSEKYAELRYKSEKRVIDNYSWKSIIDKYDIIFNNIKK